MCDSSADTYFFTDKTERAKWGHSEILSLRAFIWWYCGVLNMNLKKWLDIPTAISKHWTRQEDHSNKNQWGPKPIFGQFVNWHIAKEIRNCIIELNMKRCINVFVSQMYLKELTLKNGTLWKYRCHYLNEKFRCADQAWISSHPQIKEENIPVVSGTHSTRFFKF